jgi:hypothetical protein
MPVVHSRSSNFTLSVRYQAIVEVGISCQVVRKHREWMGALTRQRSESQHFSTSEVKAYGYTMAGGCKGLMERMMNERDDGGEREVVVSIGL